MFRVFIRKRRRRLSSPRTIALSVGVHLVLVGLVVAHSTAAPAPAPRPTIHDIWEIDRPAPADPPPPEPDAPDEPDTPPPPVPGETVELRPPATVPPRIPEPDLDARPLTDADVTGIGRPGDYIGPPPAAPTPPTGSDAPPQPYPSFGDYVYGAESVEEKPTLANAADVARLLDRNYPEALSEAGVAGRVMLEMTIDENGRVRPGSARVVSASHEEFTAATLRIAERMRFRPARVEGRAVAVMVTLPIDWKTRR